MSKLTQTRCVPCNSQRRSDIDKRLAAGESSRSVSKWLKGSGEPISHATLATHKRDHLVDGKQAPVPSTALDVVPPEGDELTPQQALFVEEYLRDLNATQAAIRAGYAEKGAAVQGFRLLRNAKISRILATRQKDLSVRTQLDLEWMLTNLALIARRCMESEPVLDYIGQPTGLWKFNASGANRAIELIGKLQGMFVEKTVTVEMDAEDDDAVISALLEKLRSAGGDPQNR